MLARPCICDKIRHICYNSINPKNRGFHKEIMGDMIHSSGLPNSPIHKAAGLTVHGRSTGLPGIIPKISKETAVQNALQTPFCTAAGRTAAL